MSRIGNKPIPIPKGTKVSIDGRTVTVEGPLGKLNWEHRAEISLEIEEGDDGSSVIVKRCDDSREARA